MRSMTYSIILYFFLNISNSIDGVKVSMLTSGAVDRWFELPSGQTKDHTIGIRCFSASTYHYGVRLLGLKSDAWFEIRIMCLSVATYLSTDCCFSELEL
jgi:hypothetical protein